MSNDSHPPKPPAGPEESGGAHKEETAPDGIPKKRALTPEEQMALYEEALKEEDWGHQPC